MTDICLKKGTHTAEIKIPLHIQELPILVCLPDLFSTEPSLEISQCAIILPDVVLDTLLDQFRIDNLTYCAW